MGQVNRYAHWLKHFFLFTWEPRAGEQNGGAALLHGVVQGLRVEEAVPSEHLPSSQPDGEKGMRDWARGFQEPDVEEAHITSVLKGRLEKGQLREKYVPVRAHFPTIALAHSQLGL